jgi:primase-polymerase (primpol)-like protein
VLGAGIGCIDLDHAIRDDGTLTEGAQALVGAYPGNWIEVSPSGRGLHIWGRAKEQAGFRKRWRGQTVEFYSQGRFITVTGRTFQRGQLEPL